MTHPPSGSTPGPGLYEPGPSESPASGPFAVEPVDALVFRQPTEAPEQRAAARYIPATQRRLAIAAPVAPPPTPQILAPWTPRTPDDSALPDTSLPATALPARPPGAAVRIAVSILTLGIPLGMVALTVWIGYRLTQGT
jgi:hypothetical protein